ncbi:MAG: metallophosphoesterase [Aureibaculum sp.]|nr:metallophosphoesterase [Aureibaculum sp.]
MKSNINSLLISLLVLMFFSCKSTSQVIKKSIVPAVYTNVHQDVDGKFYLVKDSVRIYETISNPVYTLSNMKGNPRGTSRGIFFDFGIPDFNGTLNFGFIPFQDFKYPLPVYFHSASTISKGRTNLNIKQLAGRYDMIDWVKNGKGTLGYRVLNDRGSIVYDGIVSFNVTDKGFEVAETIVEGPFVNMVTPNGATISLETNMPSIAKIMVNGNMYISEKATHHEIKIEGLTADTEYPYVLTVGNNTQNYSFKTAHLPGERKPFTFAYASDSRSGAGGGERNVYGANVYIIKKIMALAKQQNVRFTQFTGDLIGGYLSNIDQMNLQYANWKRAVEPFAHYLPIYAAMGNHEALTRDFKTKGERYGTSIDRFPFETESAEVIFANNFVNPTNGPISEDGAKYDPNRKQIDFPPYKENVFFYTFDNIAMIVMNSDYWYAPSKNDIPVTSGGLHGYIMDNQLAWVKETLKKLEKDTTIDHIFITEHTPFFPNGGHVHDDMWYNGDNNRRPWIAGNPLDKGII